MLSIVSIGNDSKTGLIEIEDGDPEEYLAHGTSHNIITNCDQLVAYWFNSGFLVQISGDISRDEMTHIIDSIYDEE